ncbi:tetratricopeptide repeat protein [Flaviramulus sp. BrNp1-15]|uniref:transcriptional regulator n=1 Tax=Flaviramulus sp. BrNp1-15 TaxID=2916754 RepID=UPI001EE86444|nr:tetratricopeptide repeat protein [Flaviramulus sp. BrNp1-15]ULC58191.1 tetratricopeptide repeat protein [Flaviramulus sp. BrNp1-15]
MVSCVHAQDQLTSEEAYNKYNLLKQDLKTKNIGLNDEAYWPYYFQLTDLLELITHDHAFVLEEYKNTAYNFRYIGLPKEAIKRYKLYFKYYNKHKQFLNKEQKAMFLHYSSSAYGFLADVYAKVSYLDSASLTHKKNIKLTQQNHNIDYASAINNYGLFFYWTKKELDSALINFNASYELTKQYFPNNHLLGSIRDNIADVYVEQGKVEEANALYAENFKFYKTSLVPEYSGIDSKRLVSAGAQMTNTAINLGQINTAKNTLAEIHQMLNDSTSKTIWFPISKLQYLQAEERVLLAQNKTHDAYQLAKRVRHLSDSLTAINNAKKNAIETTISELTFERLKAKHIIEKQQKENQIKNQRLKLWIISISSISILTFLVLLYWRRRQHIINARNKQQITELQNEKLNSEIESKQRDLSDFAINLNHNQEWAKTLAAKLNELKSTKGRERKKLFDEFEQDILNKISFDVDTKAFYERLDKLSDAFYSELNSKFPDLSKTEKRLCSLIRLKIDSHEIATLQNITVSSLNTSRYRLRKKLRLSKNDNLDDFIQSL